MQKAYSKLNNHFTSEPIFKISAALFTTFWLQKDDIVIFSCSVSQKRDFEKCSFSKMVFRL